MPGAGLTMEFSRKALSDMLTLKPYWGKPAVRNFRGGDGDVGIIRSPVRAIALLDLHGGGAADSEYLLPRKPGGHDFAVAVNRNPFRLTLARPVFYSRAGSVCASLISRLS